MASSRRAAVQPAGASQLDDARAAWDGGEYGRVLGLVDFGTARPRRRPRRCRAPASARASRARSAGGRGSGPRAHSQRGEGTRRDRARADASRRGDDADEQARAGRSVARGSLRAGVTRRRAARSGGGILSRPEPLELASTRRGGTDRRVGAAARDRCGPLASAATARVDRRAPRELRRCGTCVHRRPRGARQGPAPRCEGTRADPQRAGDHRRRNDRLAPRPLGAPRL